MAALKEIVSFSDDLLNAEEMKDHCPNGLQVEGRDEVELLVTGVSACVELFEEALKREADAVLVHHGMFWDSDPKVVHGNIRARLTLLLKNNVSLIAYHLPLDRHPKVGNNIQLVKRLGLKDPEPFGMYGGKSISYIAKTQKPMPVDDLMGTVSNVVKREVRHHAFGPDTVNRVAICSGSAPELVREAVELGADVFITGEETEWVYHLSKEEKIHYVAAGHHATEKFGVMALGDRIKSKFGIRVEFVDIPNPI